MMFPRQFGPRSAPPCWPPLRSTGRVRITPEAIFSASARCRSETCFHCAERAICNSMRSLRLVLVAALTWSCAQSQKPGPAALPEEIHLAELRRLTHGGQNAEAYWSFDGTQLSFQARGPTEQCDRIYRIGARGGAPVSVSSGKGATTCAHFLPG